VAGAAFDGWSERILRAKFQKVQALTATCVLTSAGLSGGSSLIPIVNIPAALASGLADIGIIHAFNKQVAKIYNFTSDGQLLDSSEVDDKTRDYVNNYLSARISTAIGVAMSRISTTVIASTVAEMGVGLIPIVGAAVSAAISGSAMTWCCHKINTVYYEAALDVLREMNKQEVALYPTLQ